MKFPGKRKSKYYFPVDRRDPLLTARHQKNSGSQTYVAGIVQTLVDIEAQVEDDFLDRYGLSKGHSQVLEEKAAEELYEELRNRKLITHEFAGGTIGNTLHNYSILSDDQALLFGVMAEDIHIGSYAYRYLCSTSSKVDLNHLQPVRGPIGRCFALISESGERTFAIHPGMMNNLRPESISPDLIANCSALTICSYVLVERKGTTIREATIRAIEYAKKCGIPVVLTLGTRLVIEERPEFWQRFIKEHVTVAAMNEEEAEALTGLSDPLQACDRILDWADLVLLTSGPAGLYLAGYTDDTVKRKTRHALLPGVIPEFNMYEFSRPMLKSRCQNPIRVYSFISPFMGGPEKIRNTNGAGDGALSALLHDMAANKYHRSNVPNSAKHKAEFLTYSSFSQVCKYANRVSYEVLDQHSPRLSHGLPERGDDLEETYWER